MSAPQPDGWAEIALADVASSFYGGGTPSSARDDFWGGGTPWVTTSHILGTCLRSAERTISDIGLGSSSSALVPAGNLLIGTRVGVGKSCVNEIDTAISQDITAAIVRRERFDPYFLAYALRRDAVQSRFNDLKRGATIRGVPRNDLLGIRLPVPTSLREQERIAEKLGALEQLRAASSTRTSLLTKVRSALMAKLFREGLRGERLRETEIGPLPASWRVARLGQVARVGNGSTPRKAEPGYWDGGKIPWITSGGVHEGVITRAESFVTERARAECHLPLVPARSLVVAITGQGKTLGNAAILGIEACVNQHLAYATILPGAGSPEFFLYYFQGQYKQLRAAGASGGSTKGAITCGFLSQYPVPVPAEAEQAAIVSALAPLDSLLRTAKLRANALERLFSALLTRLMTGELRLPAEAGEADG